MNPTVISVDVQSAERLLAKLSPWQLRLVKASAANKTDVEVAGELGSTYETVRFHKRQIRSQLGGLSWSLVLWIYREVESAKAPAS